MPLESDEYLESLQQQTLTRRGRLFVLSGPSGVGKGTLLDALLARVPRIVRSVSATTRAPRPGEVDGINYHFLTRDQFLEGIAEDRFFEYAVYNENYYGTPRPAVERLRSQGLDVVLEIEVQGARIVRGNTADAVLIFVLPPSLTTLEERLKGRGTDSAARIAERMRIAGSELASVPIYDYGVVNDDFEVAVDHLRSIVLAERCRIRAQQAGFSR